MKIIEKLKFSPVYDVVFAAHKYIQYLIWIKSGRKPPTPPQVKTNLINSLAKKYSIRTFIETGTYLGTTTAAVKDTFSKIFTIEIDPKLYERAKKKFKGQSKIILKKGDSSKILPLILKGINSSCLFWLDAHFSGGITSRGEFKTPIISELQTILKHKIKKNLILIDDARDFTGKNDYPTIRKLKKLISNSKYYNLKVESDIIIIYPLNLKNKIFQK